MVKKTVSLPRSLTHWLQMQARAEGKTTSELAAEILSFARAAWLKHELRNLQMKTAGKAKTMRAAKRDLFSELREGVTALAKHKSVLEVVRATAQGLHKAGVMRAGTMRKFDALCLQKAKWKTGPKRNFS